MTSRHSPPDVCPFCGLYFTLDPAYAGQRCVTVPHWRAAGLDRLPGEGADEGRDEGPRRAVKKLRKERGGPS